jgi:hypothetical protein
MSGIGLNKVILSGNAGQDEATSGTKAAEIEAVRFAHPPTKCVLNPQSEIFA